MPNALICQLMYVSECVFVKKNTASNTVLWQFVDHSERVHPQNKIMQSLKRLCYIGEKVAIKPVTLQCTNIQYKSTLGIEAVALQLCVCLRISGL